MKNSVRLLMFAAMLLSFLALPFKAMALTVYNNNITAIFGGGNPDTGWVSFTEANTQIGLRAKNSSTGATPNNGAGLYTFATGEVWNFEASFNSNVTGAGGNLTGLNQLSWTLSGPGIAGGSVTFNPAGYGDNSYGITGGANGTGAEGTFLALGGSNNIMQLSQKITFAPFNGNFNNNGLYTLTAQAQDPSQRSLILGSINIQVGDGNAPSVPDSGNTIAMLAGGLTCMGLMAQYAKKRKPATTKK